MEVMRIVEQMPWDIKRLTWFVNRHVTEFERFSENKVSAFFKADLQGKRYEKSFAILTINIDTIDFDNRDTRQALENIAFYERFVRGSNHDAYILFSKVLNLPSKLSKNFKKPRKVLKDFLKG